MVVTAVGAHPINLAHQTCHRRSLPPPADSSAANTSASASASSSLSGLGGGFWLGGFGIGGSKAPKALAEFKGEYELVADAAWSPDAIAIALGVGLALCDLFGSSTSAAADPAACAVLRRGRRRCQCGWRRWRKQRQQPAIGADGGGGAQLTKVQWSLDGRRLTCEDLTRWCDVPCKFPMPSPLQSSSSISIGPSDCSESALHGDE